MRLIVAWKNERQSLKQQRVAVVESWCLLLQGVCCFSCHLVFFSACRNGMNALLAN